jgi:uncharacterized SAM-binding protein YcdF (DUF218 family)
MNEPRPPSETPPAAKTSKIGGYRRRSIIVGVIIVTILIIFAHAPLLTGFAYCFRSQDPLAPSDAIVVLLGSYADRSTKAAALYQQDLAPIVLIGQTETVNFDETRFNFETLTQVGVPASAIRILPGDIVMSTHDEALRVRDYVMANSVRRITVVTTAYHSARARWIFRRVLDDLGVDVRVAASEDLRFNEADWYANDDGRMIYLWELFANIYYRISY